MARITVEDCLDHVDNRFDLVMLASRRARALRNYNTEALVDEENDKPTVIALREIAKGVMSHELLDSQEISPDDEEVQTDFSISNLEANRLGNDEPAAGGLDKSPTLSPNWRRRQNATKWRLPPP